MRLEGWSTDTGFNSIGKAFCIVKEKGAWALTCIVKLVRSCHVHSVQRETTDSNGFTLVH